MINLAFDMCLNDDDILFVQWSVDEQVTPSSISYKHADFLMLLFILSSTKQAVSASALP